jgi:amidase
MDPRSTPGTSPEPPGPSSAGEAAALATGMSPLGLGNDGLGSLRHPAQCCGVSVLKPTLGRIPDTTTTGPADAPIGVQLTDVQGPLARPIADLRAALEVLAGPSWRDPWSVPAPLRGPEPAKPIRVALVVDPTGQGTATQVQDGVRKAATALEDAGYAVQEVQPPSIDTAAKILLDMLNTPDIRAMWQLGSPMMPADTRRFLSAFYRVAGDPDPVTTMQSFVTRQSLLRAWGQFQQQHPLIVAPICTEVPFQAGTDLDDGQVAATIRSMRMAMAVNVLGLPAVALPVGIGDGLPQAVQVIGPRYREDLCLAAAAALEDRVGTITPIDPRGR